MTTTDVAEVVVEHLRASYDRRVLTDVTLTAAPGTTTVVMGPPGSGKTTLIRVLLGRLAADKGDVTIGGRAVTGASASELADIHRRTGFLFSGLSAGSVGRKGRLAGSQDPDDGILEKSTVGQNVRAVLDHPEAEEDRVRQWLDVFDLTDVEQQTARELDPGTRRRLALARVFVTGPALVVLDDPVAGLAPSDRDVVIEVLRRARAATDATVILTCYDLTTAKALGDYVVALFAGRVRKQGPADRMLNLIKSDRDYALAFALGGKEIAEESTESLAEHRTVLGVRGITQQMLVGIVAVIGLLALLAIIVYMAFPRMGI